MNIITWKFNIKSNFQENNKYAKTGQVHHNIDTIYFLNVASSTSQKKMQHC